MILMLSAVCSMGQQTETGIILTKKSDKIFSKTEAGDKIVEFYITGLETEDAVEKFREKFLKNDFVVSLEFIPATFDGKRKATAIFNPNLKLQGFQTLLTNAGVKTITVNDETIKTEDLLKWKEEKRAQRQK